MTNDFWPILKAVRDRLADPEGALQVAAQARFGRSMPVHIDRDPGRDAAPASALLLDGDEAVGEGEERSSLSGLRCVREVGLALLCSKLSSPAETLNALVTAAVEALHHRPLSGAARVEYAGCGRDDLPDNRAMATAVFRVVYERRP